MHNTVRGCLISFLLSSMTLIDPPQPPLKRGAKFFKVLLEKGDLGGSENI